MEIDSGPDIFVRISAPRLLQVTTPFSGILGQDLNLPWFQSFQVKPGFAAVWMFAFTEVSFLLPLSWKHHVGNLYAKYLFCQW